MHAAYGHAFPSHAPPSLPTSPYAAYAHQQHHQLQASSNGHHQSTPPFAHIQYAHPPAAHAASSHVTHQSMHEEQYAHQQQQAPLQLLSPDAHHQRQLLHLDQDILQQQQSLSMHPHPQPQPSVPSGGRGGLFSPPAAGMTSAAVIAKRVRPSGERVIQKLTMQLMETYSAINDRYYANKRRKLQEQQQQQAAAAAAATAATPHASAQATATPAQPLPPQLSAAGIPLRKGETNDGWSDREYNYIVTENELLSDQRYQVMHSIGKGSFGRVVKAWDHRDQRYVAIKMVKCKNAFFKQAQIEMKLLRSVNRGLPRNNDSSTTAASSPHTPSPNNLEAPANNASSTNEGDKWNIVCMLDAFMHQNHQCIVFELLSLNLYELLRNTRFTGISLKLIGKFTHQLLMTLAYLSCKERGEERIIHCDLKPENILLRNSKKSAIKVIDLGSACYAHQKVYTYIQSRFYRAPEILVGSTAGYNAAIDMWSLACVCFELSLGTPLFDGQDEHDQIIRQVDLLGIPPTHMIEKSKKGQKFFESTRSHPSGWQLRDPALATGHSAAAASTYIKLVHAPSRHRATEASLTPLEKLRRRLAPKYEDTPVWNAFCDLIMQMLEWDPKLRAKPAHAINHEFFTLLKKQNDPVPPPTATVAASAAPTTPILQDVPPTQTIWAPDLQSSSHLPPLSSSVFSAATVAAFTYQPPSSSVQTNSNGTGSAAAASNAAAAAAAPASDTLMSDLAPTSAPPVVTGVPSATESSAMNIDSGSQEGGAAMDVDENSRTKVSAARAIPPPHTAHTTPTRKRHSESSPRSPSSVQGTPKTRAAAAASARQLFQTTGSPRTRSSSLIQASPATHAHSTQADGEIEHMQLPSMAYQSPSMKPVNHRNAAITSRTRSEKGPGGVPFNLARSVPNQSFVLSHVPPSTSASGGAMVPAAGVPVRRGSENLHESHGVRTRAQKSALHTPPLGPVPSSSLVHMDRRLASDPIALHLDPTASSSSSSPPSGPQLFEPPTLRPYATRSVTTRRQAAAETTEPATDEEETRRTNGSARKNQQAPTTPRTRGGHR